MAAQIQPLMKKIAIALLLATGIITTASAQKYGQSDCAKVYLGVTTGIDNPAGVLGFTVDVPIVPSASLNAGVGLSGWGYKTYIEGRYYFKECHRGWALGAGLSYNTGLTGFDLEAVDASNNNINAKIDLLPVKNLFFAGYHFFNLGRGGNRFHLSLGYSYCLDGTGNYRITTQNTTISPDGRTVLDIIQPGGLMFGLGFTFAIGR